MRLRMAAFLLLMAVFAVIVGCGKSPSGVSSNGDNSTTAPSSGGGLFSHSVTVPEGTSIVVRLDQTISSKTSHSGDTFTATVAQPVSIGDKVAIPEGSTASGTVVTAKARGRFKGAAILKIVLNQGTVRNNNYTVDTNADSRYIKGKGKHTATMIGGAAGLGALLAGLPGGRHDTLNAPA